MHGSGCGIVLLTYVGANTGEQSTRYDSHFNGST